MINSNYMIGQQNFNCIPEQLIVKSKVTEAEFQTKVFSNEYCSEIQNRWQYLPRELENTFL